MADPLLPEDFPPLPWEEGSDENPMTFEPTPVETPRDDFSQFLEQRPDQEMNFDPVYVGGPEGTDANPMVFEPDVVTPDAPPTVDALAGQTPSMASATPPGEFDSFLEHSGSKPQGQPFDLDTEVQAYANSPVPESEYVPELLDKEYNRVEQLTPEQRAREALQREYERAQSVEDAHTANRARNIELANKNLQAMMDGQKRATEEWHQVQQIYQNLQTQKIDNDHWWGSRTTSQKIAAYGAAIISGWLNPHGENQAINTFKSAINEDIETQRFSLNNQRNLAGDRANLVSQIYQQTQDEYRSSELARIMLYESSEEQLLADAAKYDPLGTTAQKYAAVVGQIRAERQKTAIELETNLHKRAMEEAHLEVQQFSAQSEAAHRKEEEKIGKWGMSLRGKELNAQMLKEGFVPDGRGGYQLDEELAKKLRESNQTKREEKITQEMEQFERGSRVTINDKELGHWEFGRARGGEDAARHAEDMLISYLKFRKGMSRLIDIVQANKSGIYKGPGSERWQNAAKTEVDALRTDLANQLAKLRDPTSTNREGEVKIAMSELPSLNGWTEEKNPTIKYKTLVKTADDSLDTYLGGKLEQYDFNSSPVSHYQSQDEFLLGGDPASATKETLLKEAITPIDPLVRQNDDLFDAAMRGRRNRFNAIGDMSGFSKDEYHQAVDSLRHELELGPSKGGLKPDEYIMLKKTLDENYKRGTEGSARIQIENTEKTNLGEVPGTGL